VSRLSKESFFLRKSSICSYVVGSIVLLLLS
jgi:hypothetical protein